MCEILDKLFKRSIKRRNWWDYISEEENESLLKYFNKSETVNNLKDLLFSEIRYIYLKNLIEIPKCPICGTYVSYSKPDRKYNEFCSKDCRNSEKAKKIIKEKQKVSMLEKYGVENYSKTNEFKVKVKKSMLEKYGVEHYSQTGEFKEKFKETSLNKYGVEHPFQADVVKEKIRDTMIDKYGVSSGLQSEEIKEKIKDTNRRKYGSDWQTQSENFKEKTAETNKKRYGEEQYSQTEDFKDKYKQTMNDIYNVDHYSQTEEYKEKLKETSLEKYGVEHPFLSEEIQKKCKSSLLEKYGVEYASQIEEIKEKMKQTNLERYGVPYASQADSIKEKIKDTNLEKYGVEYPSKLTEFKDKAEITRRANYYSIFIDKLNNKHLEPLFNKEYFLDLDNISYKMKCKKCENIFITYKRNPQKIYCDNCINLVSIPEYELTKWLIEDHNIEVVNNKRFFFEGKKNLELDLFLPEYNIGIEYYGQYWHSSKFKDKKYHYDKYSKFKGIGIDIIQIFESEWLTKEAIVKSIILNRLGKSFNKIMGRKCKIKEVSIMDYKEFCETNHLQGYAPAKYKLGLYNNEELIMIMSFSKARYSSEAHLENIRTCSKLDTIVLGGFSKLLKYAKNIFKDKVIVSYIDLRYFSGLNYIKNGFSVKHISNPNFFYFRNNDLTLLSRITFQKHKLNTLLKNYNGDLTTEVNMKNNGYYKIYDAGNLVVALKC